MKEFIADWKINLRYSEGWNNSGIRTLRSKIKAKHCYLLCLLFNIKYDVIYEFTST